VSVDISLGQKNMAVQRNSKILFVGVRAGSQG
jgi:hypothetical protein